MQASGSLSPEQSQTLRSVCTFLEGATTYLEAVEPVVFPEDRPQLVGLVALGHLASAKLCEHFPQVAEWRKRGAP